MGFKEIMIEKYIELYLKHNPSENKSDLEKRLKKALTDYQNGIKWSCGNDIWVIGSASTGNGCFTCTTGEIMPKAKILYQSKEEIYGKHLRAEEWIEYSGKITVYDRKTSPVILKIKSEIYDSFMRDIMDDEKEFKGNSVSEVYAKLQNGYIREK